MSDKNKPFAFQGNSLRVWKKLDKTRSFIHKRPFIKPFWGAAWVLIIQANSANTNFVLFWQFMQRGLDSETKKQLEEEEKKIISEEHWYLDLPELKEKE